MTAVATMKAELRSRERRALQWGASLLLLGLTLDTTAGASPQTGDAPAAPKEAPSSEERPSDVRGLDLLFLETETGAAYAGLQTLHVKRDVVPTSTRSEDIGGFFGLAGGIKLLFLSIGPHARLGRFQDWDLWTLDLDVGFHAPLGPIEPYFRLGGGYARLSRAFDKVRNGGSLRSDGYNVSLALGVDYFVTRHLTVGGKMSGELIGLHRAGVNLDAQDGLVNDYLKYDGAALGLALSGGLALGLHL